jgi:alcohol dehydrogenase class IV
MNIMRFEFATAARIYFGEGALDGVGKLAASLGTRALIVTGRDPTRAALLQNRLDEAGVWCVTFAVFGEPTVDTANAAVAMAREHRCDCIIGFGGGSAIDTGKAVAALLAHDGEPLDYVELIGRGKPLTNPSLPYIAIPTTAGTGAEVTSNAVLASPEHRVKVSLRSPLMLPRAAVVDPAVTYDLPPDITARTGMDALTQVLEPFVSNKSSPITDALCREGLHRASRSLQAAFEDGQNKTAREDMALASLFGGLALANAKLGAVHGFAGPIGGMFDAPHGAICALLLPHVMRANIHALREREPHGDALRRYDEIARTLTGDPHMRADDGAEWVSDLSSALQIRSLSAYGITSADLAEIVEKSANASSMQGNPIKLTSRELMSILEAAL